jgi:hypothetical protein
MNENAAGPWQGMSIYIYIYIYIYKDYMYRVYIYIYSPHRDLTGCMARRWACKGLFERTRLNIRKSRSSTSPNQTPRQLENSELDVWADPPGIVRLAHTHTTGFNAFNITTGLDRTSCRYHNRLSLRASRESVSSFR